MSSMSDHPDYGPSLENLRSEHSGRLETESLVPSSEPELGANINQNDSGDYNSTTATMAWENDPDNPMNWPQSKKLGIISAVCLMRFTTPLASSMMAPALSQIGKEFGETNTLLLTSTVSIYVIGFGIGPLLMAPLSEVYGRNVVYHVGNVLFTIFTACCGVSPNTASLVIFRLLAGFVAGAPLTNGGGTIADIVPIGQRGMIMSIFGFSMLIAPVVGPIAGGFLAESAGWRWIFWLLTIMSGIMTLFGFVFLRETYSPRLLAKKAKKLSHDKGEDCAQERSHSSVFSLLIRAITRPVRMFFSGPITSLASLYMGVIYGVTYLLFTTFAVVFQDVYGFEEGIAGLCYLGIGIGCAVGSFVFGHYSDKIHARLSSKHGQAKPEFRLNLLIPCGLTFPIGLVIYGWTAQNKVHWIVPIIGTVFFGVGSACALASIQIYIVDAFAQYAASALAANSLIRSLAGGLVPLGGLKMYDKMGLGWGNSLLAFISLIFGLAPVIFYKHGEQWRQKYHTSFE